MKSIPPLAAVENIGQ